MRMFLTLAACVLLLSTAQAREWVDASGKHKIDAEFLALADDGTVVLRKADRKILALPITSLSAESQQTARELAAGKTAAPAAATHSGAGLPEADIKFGRGVADAAKPALAAEIASLLRAEVVPLDAPAVGKVFDGQMFRVTLTVGGENQSMSVDQNLLLRGEKATEIAEPSSDEPLPQLASMAKKDFAIKSDADAKVFEAALDVLYPVNDMEKEFKAIRHAGSKWTFVRGDFFEKRKGFVVTVSADGAITTIDHSLSIAKE